MQDESLNGQLCHCLRDHRQWHNSFWAGFGLFTMFTVLRLARQYRCGTADWRTRCWGIANGVRR